MVEAPRLWSLLGSLSRPRCLAVFVHSSWGHTLRYQPLVRTCPADAAVTCSMLGMTPSVAGGRFPTFPLDRSRPAEKFLRETYMRPSPLQVFVFPSFSGPGKTVRNSRLSWSPPGQGWGLWGGDALFLPSAPERSPECC